MSQMTLRQGIETTLLEEVPELTKRPRRHRPRQRREPLLLLSIARIDGGVTTLMGHRALDSVR